MKKIIIALVLLFAFSTAATAASCTGAYQIFSAYIKQGSSYVFYKNYMDSNKLINDIESNPQVSGYVRSQDTSCDAWSTWNFANGTYWQVR